MFSKITCQKWENFVIVLDFLSALVLKKILFEVLLDDCQ